LDYARQWSVRILHEAQMWEDNCVITLTYDEENIPPWGTLVKADFRKFMKSLRYQLRPKKIRYYHCGEYGEQLGRPHYHAVLFNQQFEDLEIFEEKETGNVYTSKILEKIWGKGFVTVMDLTLHSAGYVARYITKKINGDMKDDHYKKVCEVTGEIHSIQQEYATMSRKPGIGSAWYEKYKGDVFPSDDCIVLSKNSYHHVPTPKYYDIKLERENPSLYDKIKQRREVFANTHIKDNTLKRLKSREVCKIAQTKNQNRNII